MKGCVQWNSGLPLKRFRSQRGSNSVRKIIRPALNPLSNWGSSFNEGHISLFLLRNMESQVTKSVLRNSAVRLDFPSKTIPKV